MEKWFESDQTINLSLWFLPLPGINSYENHKAFWGSRIEKVGLRLTPKKPINWAGRTRGIDLSKFEFGKVSKDRYIGWKKKISCNHMRNYLHVLHNRDIIPCCVIPEVWVNGEIEFGNANQDLLLDVWVRKKYL